MQKRSFRNLTMMVLMLVSGHCQAVYNGQTVDRSTDPVAQNVGALFVYRQDFAVQQGSELSSESSHRPNGHCTAALISPTVAITAAHCILSRNMRMSFNDDISDAYFKGSTNNSRRVTSVWVLPSYHDQVAHRCNDCSKEEFAKIEASMMILGEHKAVIDDIALIRLEAPFKDAKGLPIAVTASHFKAADGSPRKISNVTIIGYGSQSLNKDEFSAKSLKSCVMATKKGSEYDYQQYEKSGLPVEQLSQIVWLLTNDNLCSPKPGDSGAPLIAFENTTHRAFVVGVNTTQSLFSWNGNGFKSREEILHEGFSSISPYEKNPFKGNNGSAANKQSVTKNSGGVIDAQGAR